MIKTPRHVAIIMDGNGRWAESKGMPRVMGHSEGVKRVKEIIQTAGTAGVKYLTLYTFSEENWKRPKGEVDFLLGLFEERLQAELDELKRSGVRFLVIGNLSALPASVQEIIGKASRETAENKGLTLILALSYSGRSEIVEACRRFSRDVSSGKTTPESLTADSFGQYLYTAGIPDPEFLIRTSGECRISNFLLWQLSYAEFYFTDTLWPDFTGECFLKALEEYGKRERRFGLTEAVN